MISEEEVPGFRGPKVSPSKNGKVIGVEKLFFEKSPIKQNNKTIIGKIGPPGGGGGCHAHERSPTKRAIIN